jgi:tetratricopeptide (TPR) repeat protein
MEGRLRHQEPVRQLTGFLLLLALALGTEGAALAQQPAPSESDMARAKELFENGQILYQEGRYEQAIQAWEEAYRLSGRAELLYNVSSAYEKAGKYREAIDALNKYRVYAKADERETLDRRIRALEERLAAAPATPVKPADPVVTPVVTAPVEPVAPVEPAKDGGFRVLPAVLIGTGAVGLGTGGVFALQVGSAMDEIRGSCVEGDAGYLCPSSAQPASDKRDSAALISTIGFGVGGALTAAGLGLLVAGGGGSSDVEVTLAPGWQDGPNLALGGSF